MEMRFGTCRNRIGYERIELQGGRERIFSFLIFFVLVLSVCSQIAVAKTKKSNSFYLLQEKTINTIIDVTARSVARRYDLNPEQAKLAKEMIEKNSWDFINENYETLSDVIPKLYELRSKAFSGQDPSAEEVQQVAEKLYPLIVQASNLIISENEKFDTYLNDKQKVKHRKDMEKMKQDFARMKRKFKRWKEGGYQPGEFLRGSRRRRKARRLREEQAKAKTLDPTQFDFWEMYVKTFIEAFQLDQGQITLAYSVLNDMKARANAYRNDHAREFKEIRGNIERLSRSNTTQPTEARMKQLKEYKSKLEKLNKPLLDMFEELKQRLMDIPTESQRKKAQELLNSKNTRSKSEK